MSLNDWSLPLGSWNLDFFNSGEWEVVQEKLNELEDKGIRICPTRKDIFRALELVKPEDVRVVMLGQDPYPTTGDATGVAFSVPKERRIPPTLSNIFDEYCSDLHYPRPGSGDLSAWCSQGVLLWNAYPTCTVGKPGSHHWTEWETLTKEIVEKLDERMDTPFCLLGNAAKSFERYIHGSPVVSTSHPSPLGAKYGFLGSRIFTRINGKLCDLGKEPINWRLP